jgi:type II secretory pathway component GspD/PulD (secretin)
MSTTENLFYAISDKRLFWIAGYTDNTTRIAEHVEMLQNKTKQFSELINIDKMKSHDTENIMSDFITKSRRYKQMRYFWLNDVKQSDCPKNAYVLDNDWTMVQWHSHSAQR